VHGRISYSFGDTEAKVDWGSFYPPLARIRVKQLNTILCELTCGTFALILDAMFVLFLWII